MDQLLTTLANRLNTPNFALWRDGSGVDWRNFGLPMGIGQLNNNPAQQVLSQTARNVQRNNTPNNAQQANPFFPTGTFPQANSFFPVGTFPQANFPQGGTETNPGTAGTAGTATPNAPFPISGGQLPAIDARGNNVNNPTLGATNTLYNQLAPKDPTRSPNSAASANLPGAREVSNAVHAQEKTTTNRRGLNDLFWQFGQFLDHDITDTPTEAGRKSNIAVPTGDPFFDPQGTGAATIDFTSSATRQGPNGVPQQINSLSAFVDGSNIYGHTEEEARGLRTLEGGKLRTGEQNLLPEDERGRFVAGDHRAGENPGLASIHTVWMREHNRLADEISQLNPNLSDQEVYDLARGRNIAQLQAVTYNEYLPNLLGEFAPGTYQGYSPNVDPSISSEFASAAYRFGHTMLSSTLRRVDENGQTIAQGDVDLRDGFFNADKVKEAGIDPLLRGSSQQAAQAIDPEVVDDVRNFLFGQPGSGGFDLAALNIQRGRDHQVASYNDVRQQLGLPRINSFNDPIFGEYGAKLASVYNSPDELDLWTAGLAEQKQGSSMLGETFTMIVGDQFDRIRSGDRLWYENTLQGPELETVRNTTFADIIRRNSGVQSISDNAFAATQQPAPIERKAVVPNNGQSTVVNIPENAPVNQELDFATLERPVNFRQSFAINEAQANGDLA